MSASPCFFQRNGLYLAWVVSLIGFCLTIVYGEVLQHTPCSLCWYQRTALFPLVLILGLAAYRDERMIIPYTLPLALLGALVALFQTVEFYVPFSGMCHAGERCSGAELLLFGLPFPLISTVGFTVIAVLLFLSKRGSGSSG